MKPETLKRAEEEVEKEMKKLCSKYLTGTAPMYKILNSLAVRDRARLLEIEEYVKGKRRTGRRHYLTVGDQAVNEILERILTLSKSAPERNEQ